LISKSALAPLALFERADPCVVDVLARRGIEVRFATDTVLFLAGSKPRGWFIVLEGLVRVVRGGGNRQHVIHTEGPGGTLGEVPVFTDGVHPATGIAAEPTRCALFDRATLTAAIDECPAIAFILIQRLALRVESLVTRLDARSASSVRARLIDFLLARHDASASASFSIGMTQQGLAEELGTVREIVVRELRKLKQERLVVQLQRGRLEIRDVEALRRARQADSSR
jgi:CRP/FNR family transcriptional regulator